MPCNPRCALLDQTSRDRSPSAATFNGVGIADIAAMSYVQLSAQESQPLKTDDEASKAGRIGMKTHDWNKIQHTPANIPQTPNQQFMKEFGVILGV